MSFDIHNSLKAVRLYGLLLLFLFVVAVLQPQSLVRQMLGEGDAFGVWGTHILGSLAGNLLAVLIATGVAWFLDIFDVRRAATRG